MKYTSEEKSHQAPTWQEILRDGELSPPDSLWEAIEAQLPEKKPRRILPIWWSAPLLRIASGLLRTLGTAAALYIWQGRDIHTLSSNKETTTKQTQTEKQHLALTKLAQIEKGTNLSPSSPTRETHGQLATNELANGRMRKLVANSLIPRSSSPWIEIDKEGNHVT